MTHFNKLTPAETERLAMLAEECAEVIQVIGKILRHGYENHHPDSPLVNNKMLLANELTDVDAVVKAMKREELKDFACQDFENTHWQKKLRYSHHQSLV